MRFRYLLYPKAFKKLKNSGIEARVQKLKDSENGLPYIGGHVYEDEVINSVQDLKERGFYEHLPRDFAQKYKEIMNGIFRKPEDFSWSVQRPNEKITEPCNLEDILLFSGDLASMILNPEEIWDYQKFGFSSPSDFVTTVGAYILQQSRETLFREGYKWKTKRLDSSEIVTEITGDSNADLRVYQTDIAPYPTTDPFGNAIEMRPEMDADRQIIAANHSTEGTMLVAVMKYIEQQGIKAEYQKDDAKQLLHWGKSLGQCGGSCTEHFGGFDQSPLLFFSGYDYPIPQLNENNETDQHTNFWLGTTGESGYGTYIANNGDLVFSHQGRDAIRNPQKSIAARYLPDDAEHLVKGLLFQAAKGLGRTSARQLLDILEYRHSPQFEVDRQKYR
ncbi:MAG: hypothetical protein ACOCUT_00385 [bacterium]